MSRIQKSRIRQKFEIETFQFHLFRNKRIIILMVKNRYLSFIFASKCSQRAIWLIFGDILSVNVKFSQFFLFCSWHFGHGGVGSSVSRQVK